MSDYITALPITGSHTKWLAYPLPSHLSPKSTSSSSSSATDLTSTFTISASFNPSPLLPACPQSYFHALRVGYCAGCINKSLIYSSSWRQQMAATISDEMGMSSSPAVIRLKPIEATPESFQEFGQVIEASPDGDEFGPGDAQLDLSRGIPRFYIMHLEDRPLGFSTITHHASVTQCLGSIGGHVWYLGVAKPSIVEQDDIKGAIGEDVMKSHCGHFYVPPAVEDVRVFKISGPKFLKLNRGTWHAGPLFVGKTMDFYNLELSNTNVVDHTTHNFVKKNNVKFSFDV